MKKVLHRKLSDEANKNTNVSILTEDGEKVDTKMGVPLDTSAKLNANSSLKFGISKGVTLNMGNFQSCRIDVWLSDEVREGETIIEAMNRVSSIIDERLSIEAEAMEEQNKE